MESAKSIRLIHGLVTKAATKTVIREFCGGAYDKQIVKKIKKMAESTVNELSTTLHNIREGKEGKDAVSHLPEENTAQMNQALDPKTFKMKVDVENKKALIDNIDDRKGTIAEKDLAKKSELLETSDLQNASIVAESIIFLIEIAGIAIPSDWDHIQKVIEYFKQNMTTKNYILEHIKQIVENRDSYPALIRSIIALVCDLYIQGDFWKIVKLLYGRMSWADTILNAAKIAAYIGLMTATSGILQIANLTLKFVQVGEFVIKLKNAITLSDIGSKKF